jgi:hypothetical protein
MRITLSFDTERVADTPEVRCLLESFFRRELDGPTLSAVGLSLHTMFIALWAEGINRNGQRVSLHLEETRDEPPSDPGYLDDIYTERPPDDHRR